MSTRIDKIRILVCDRCEDEFRETSIDKRIPRVVLLKFGYEPYLDTEKDYNAVRIDLCPWCTKIFDDFMSRTEAKQEAKSA